ncbi:Protein amnionless [Sarcoptes scabiei]|nr:Protein amnionless [Sarcoptes scabiei]
MDIDSEKKTKNDPGTASCKEVSILTDSSLPLPEILKTLENYLRSDEDQLLNNVPMTNILETSLQKRFQALILPFRASYMAIDVQYFNKINQMSIGVLRQKLSRIMDIQRISKEDLIETILDCFEHTDLLLPIQGDVIYRIGMKAIRELKTDLATRERIRKVIYDKMIRKYIPFQNDPHQDDTIYFKRIFTDFLLEASNDPLLTDARTLSEIDPKFDIKTSLKLTFKCWTCKYYYQLGQTQTDFFSFQFRDFCSLKCLTASMNVNDICLLEDPGRFSSISRTSHKSLNWSKCSFTMSFYDCDDIDRNYVRIFRDEDQLNNYVATAKLCFCCKTFLENKQIHSSLSLGPTKTVYFCKNHGPHHKLVTNMNSLSKCSVCNSILDKNGHYFSDFFWESKIFCSALCKLLYFKANFAYNQCAVCFKTLASFREDFESYKTDFYLIRCFWTFYKVCSTICYFKFRSQYSFPIKCWCCSITKLHSDMIGVMDSDKYKPYDRIEWTIDHYCSLNCLHRSRSKQNKFHPFPLISHKYLFDLKIEIETITFKCITCRRNFRKPRCSPITACSWKCHINRKRINLDNSLMIDGLILKKWKKIDRRLSSNLADNAALCLEKLESNFKSTISVIENNSVRKNQRSSDEKSKKLRV